MEVLKYLRLLRPYMNERIEQNQRLTTPVQADDGASDENEFSTFRNDAISRRWFQTSFHRDMGRNWR